nr:MAG TPA: hypothetical protein [Caudoviricetes sp.]
MALLTYSIFTIAVKTTIVLRCNTSVVCYIKVASYGVIDLFYFHYCCQNHDAPRLRFPFYRTCNLMARKPTNLLVLFMQLSCRQLYYFNSHGSYPIQKLPLVRVERT